MGDKRKRLVEQFGFDTKNAAHLIRLLKMGLEYLATGELKVYRTDDAAELIEIKRGGWPKDRVIEYAESLFSECDRALETSPLPLEIDQRAVAEVLGQLYRARYGVKDW